MLYTTHQGDVLDWICWQHYGHERGTTEAVLRANPGLARQPVILPDGVMITLPDIVVPKPEQRTIQLWD